MSWIRAFYKCLSKFIAPMAIAVAVIFWSLPAAAAGFYLPTRGVEASGRGAATVAPHRADLNSLWYNPAGLSLIEDLQLSIDVALVGANNTFQRAPRQMDDGSTRTYEAVSNEAPPNAIPSIFIGGPTPHPDISWAAGLYTPYSSSARYPVDGPQRYSMVDNTGSGAGYLHGGVGWQVSHRLALGAGLQNFMGSIRLVTVGSGYVGMFGDPEDEDLDILAEARVTSFFTPTANLGVTYLIGDRVQTGFSAQLPFSFRDRQATIDTRLPSHPAYDNAETSGNRADITIPFPFFLRAGARYFGHDFDVELSVVYQHWSVLDQVVATPDNVEITGVPGMGNMPIEPLITPHGFRNTFSLHLGGERQFSDDFSLRAGFIFERGAVPDTQYSVYLLDPNKYQPSVGMSYAFGAWTMDLSAAAVIMPSKVITNSQARQVNPSDEDGELSLVVGNGTYDHFGYVAGVGFRYGF